MSKRVLVVDDSVFIQEEMKCLLMGTNYEIVGFAKNGEQAQVLYEQLQPDVVTMDIILPGMDGIDATRLLLKRWPTARVVIVSSLAYDETMDEAKNVGACGFVFKPMEPQELIHALDKAADKDVV